MPTTRSPEVAISTKPSVRAIQVLLNTLDLGRKWTYKEWHEAQLELNLLRQMYPELDT